MNIFLSWKIFFLIYPHSHLGSFFFPVHEYSLLKCDLRLMPEINLTLNSIQFVGCPCCEHSIWVPVRGHYTPTSRVGGDALLKLTWNTYGWANCYDMALSAADKPEIWRSVALWNWEPRKRIIFPLRQ